MCVVNGFSYYVNYFFATGDYSTKNVNNLPNAFHKNVCNCIVDTGSKESLK